MPILEGLDGVQKMSKSLGNYIGIADAPDEMFGKIMSVSDDLMWRYFELLSFRPMSEIGAMRESASAGKNPRDIKFLLGEELVDRFHGTGQGAKARDAFIARFQQGAMPDEIEEIRIGAQEGGVAITALLRDAGLVPSTSEAMRMIKAGAVRIDGERVDDPKQVIKSGSSHVFQVGKRKFARVFVD
jgi:tyrosyl-tRNA synthetase